MTTSPFTRYFSLAACCAAGIASAQYSDQLNILPLGDSMTSGANYFDVEGEGGYRTVLEDNLELSGIKFDFKGFRALDGEGGGGGFLKDVDHEGWGGYYLDGVSGDGGQFSLAEAIKTYERVSGSGAQLVLLMMGTNDVIWYPGAQASDTELARRYNKLLDEIYRQAPDILIAASTIPRANPNTSNPLASNAEIRNFNSVVTGIIEERQARGERIFGVDGYSALNKPTEDIGVESSTPDPDSGVPLPDGVHPTKQGFKKLGDLWYRAVEPVYWDVDSLYARSIALGDGWRFSPVFKNFSDQDSKGPGWKFHETIGWMYTPQEDSGTNLYFWTPQLGWVYTANDIYPDVYRFDTGSWYFFNESNNRSLFNYGSGNWENF